MRELVAGAHEYTDLEPEEPDDVPEAGATQLDLFLQKVSLLTNVDRHDPQAEAITLMTLHNAKGLEFPYVFIAGLEDGLFPLARAFDDPAMLEEERRLFYVGVTRARRKLYLLHARSRRRAGEIIDCIPSSFLKPIPATLTEQRTTPALERRRLESSTPDRAWQRRAAPSPSPRSTPFDDDSGRGVYIDYTDAQDVPRFVKGERVRHPEFGRGTIRELSGFGPDLKATIEFDGAGRKKVMVRYANLQKEL